MIKTIIFGCQKITLDIIDYLIKEKRVKILKLYTYELPADYARTKLSLVNEAKNRNVEVVNSKNFSQNDIDNISLLSPDVIISSYYRKLLPKQIFSKAKISMNIHPSYLPYYRGPVPTAWAILNGENKFGVSIHEIDNGIDTGNIFIQKLYNIKPLETGYELYSRAMEKGFQLFKNSFFKIVEGKIKSKKQKDGGSYYGILKDEVMINWADTKENIVNKVRVRARPYNPMQTCLYSKYLIINKIIPYKKKLLIQKPGYILKVLGKNKLLVSVANGAVIVDEYEFFPSLSQHEEKIYIKAGNFFSSNLS